MSNSLTNSIFTNSLAYSGTSTISTIWSDSTTITTNPYYGSVTNPYNNYGSWNISTDVKYSELSNLNYEIMFSKDKDNYLKDNIVSINDKLLTFNCDFVDKGRIQPYELIMKMINDKIKFNIVVEVSDILTVKYQDVKFKKIKNNFSFTNDVCSFNTLQVSMKSKNVIYENHRLHITEQRKEKLEKIMEL